MRTFLLTSIKFGGEVHVFFDDENNFAGITFCESQTSIAQRRWFLKNLPQAADDIVFYKNQGIDVIEEGSVVTFSEFWDKYDDKLNSSRKKAEVKWNKLGLRDKNEAYKYINTYFLNLPTGTRKKYAETYLNSELWNN